MDTHAAHRLASDVFFLSGWIVAAIFSLWLATGRRPGFPRVLLAPGVLCVAVSLIFIGVYSTYRPIDPNANILERKRHLDGFRCSSGASLLSLLLWLVCLSLVLVRRKAD